MKSDLSGEIFGPTTLLVNDASREQILAIARSLGGHLTATVHGTEDDLREYADLIAILETKVGRLLFNGFPTGVEVYSRDGSWRTVSRRRRMDEAPPSEARQFFALLALFAIKAFPTLRCPRN